MSVNPKPHPYVLWFITVGVILNTVVIGFVLYRLLQLEAVAVPISDEVQQQIEQDMQEEEAKKLQTHYIKTVAKRFKKDEKFVTKVVHAVVKYERESFPKAADLIAIIGVESSWNKNAVSNLKKDPAVGLTQIRPKAWSHKIPPGDLKTVDDQVRWSAYILHHYYKRTGSVEDAVIAYNIGLRARMEGRTNQNYLMKYQREKTILVDTSV